MTTSSRGLDIQQDGFGGEIPGSSPDVLDNDWEQAMLLLESKGHHHLAGCVQDLADEIRRLRGKT